MKMYILPGVLLSVIFAITARQTIAQTGPAGTGDLTVHDSSIGSSQTDTNPPPTPHPGIPDADWEDHKQWRETPEYKTMVAEIKQISHDAGTRHYLTSNEVERLIIYMQSPHHAARYLASTTAANGLSDPAKAKLMPYVLNLLSDPVGIVRMAAAYTLGEIGDKTTIPRLKPLLNDPIAAKNAQVAITKLQQRPSDPMKSQP
jgi:HEAT repeats